MKSLLFHFQFCFFFLISSSLCLVAQPTSTDSTQINMLKPIPVNPRDSSVTKLSASKKEDTRDSSSITLSKISLDSLYLEKSKDSLLQESLHSYLASITPKIFTYDSIMYFIESKDLFLKDTLEYDLKSYQFNHDSTRNLIIAALEHYTQKSVDSTVNKKKLTETFDYLYKAFSDYSTYKELINEVTDSISIIKRELEDLKQKKVKWASKNDKAISDSIKKYVNVKKAQLFTIPSYRGVSFRVLIVPMNDYVVKLDPDLLKKTRTLKSSWDGFKKNKPIALFNAGMYEIDGSAVGLQVVDGKILSPINLNKGPQFTGNFYMQPNGIFFVEKSGYIGVKNTSEFNKVYSASKYAEVMYATQSGPMLVNNGQINRVFNIKSENRNIRNGIGVVGEKGNQTLISIISSGVCTFHEIASLFRLFGCANALYLDGAVSVMYTDFNSKKSGNLNSGAIGPVLAIFKK